MKNAIFVIKPYQWNGMWVFDDQRVGLDKEPFVAGADTMIDTAVQVKGIPNAENGFLMVFSAGPFPDADVPLNLQTLIDAAYVNGRCADDLDYAKPPRPKLRGPDAAWAEDVLRKQGLCQRT